MTLHGTLSIQHENSTIQNPIPKHQGPMMLRWLAGWVNGTFNAN